MHFESVCVPSVCVGGGGRGGVSNIVNLHLSTIGARVFKIRIWPKLRK